MALAVLRSLVVAALVVLAGPARAQGLSGFLSPGPLAQPHAELDSLTQCTKCHAAGEGVSATKCLACHDEVAAQVRTRRGFHADKGTTCLPCHPDHRGRDFHMIRFDQDTFDHDATGFALGGRHAELDCEDCHTGGKFTGLDRACTACHEDPHGSDLSHRALGAGCTACHSDRSWDARPLPRDVFDHGRADHAAFALEGAHADVDCEECHQEWRFVPTESDRCTDCHRDPHRAPFSDACETCHEVVADWRVPRFDHDVTGYVLQGVHRGVACKSCHGSDVTRPKAHGTCADCHRDPHRGQFAPRPCDACHSVLRPGFALLDFDHAATGWPLLGEHAEATCAACHGDGPEAEYAAVSTECATCHDDAHAGHFAPDPCDACHAPTGWTVASFDHARTAFPLTGAHRDAACADCHPPHVLTGLAHAVCGDCHRDDPHDDSVAPDTCESCHTTEAWATVAFDHAARTKFVLAPQHLEADCAACHVEVHRFVGLSTTCAECHLADRPPDHFDGPCDGCHRAADWLPADLGPGGHDATGFPLRGSHGRAPCASCHTPGLPRGAVPVDCVGCHAADDWHRNLLGDACGDCHTETVWVRTRWRHELAGWPLRGAHRLAGCDDCHATGYAGTPTECFQCHVGQAPRGVPAHASPYFPSCDHCHQPYTWAAPRYPH